MMTERDMTQTIRQLLDAHGRLTVQARLIRTGDDLFARGLTGLAAVDVLLAAEAAFGVTFPPTMMARSSISSIDALLGCLHRLQAQPLAA